MGIFKKIRDYAGSFVVGSLIFGAVISWISLEDYTKFRRRSETACVSALNKYDTNKDKLIDYNEAGRLVVDLSKKGYHLKVLEGDKLRFRRGSFMKQEAILEITMQDGSKKNLRIKIKDLEYITTQ